MSGMMEKLDLLFYSVESLAARWKLSVDQIWQFAAQGELKLMTWYAGYYLEPGKDYQEKKDPTGWYSGPPFISQWVGILPNDALQFSVPPYVEYIEVIRIIVDNKEVMPAETKQKYDLPIEPISIRIDRGSVVVAIEEIKRMEAKYPELKGEEGGQAGKNQNSELHPAVKKSLYKMILGMAMKCHRYNPDDKKSPVPLQIANAVKLAGMSIDEDTVRFHLKEAVKLQKEEEEKDS